MKIHFISNSLGGGGAERVMVILANFFVTKGHCVTIITFNEGAGDAYDIDDKIKRVRLHSGLIKNHTLRSLYNLVLFYKNFKNRPQVCISFCRTTNFSSIISCKIFAIKIIASEHSNHLRNYDIIGNFTWNYLYRFANYITVLTKFDKPFFEKRGANVIVMPNPSTFKPLENLHLVRKKIILAVGNLNRYHIKGFDNLIRLISPILKEYPEWRLNIVGGGDEGLDFLKNLAIKEGIEEHIIFSGFSKDVNVLMQESEIFVLSSRIEGLPMALLEAMSQGMACIAFDCITGPSEMITHGENGLLIEDQDMQAMQRGLVKLISDEGLRRRFSHNAVKSLDRYSIKNVYGIWESLFGKLYS